MGITFNTNLPALGAQRNITSASNAAASSLQKLSSGSRIPQAKDDAAGLAIGSKLKAEVAGLTQASNNAGQAISLLQIADGALSTVGDILVRLKSLATQSSSGQLADADRSLLNQEFTNLKAEIDRIAATSNFNGTRLLAGTAGVLSNVNDVSTTGTTPSNGTPGTIKNLIGQGVSSISFGSSFTPGAASLSYNALGNQLTLTNLITGQADTVNIGSTAIASGSTQTVNFNSLGATVTLNSAFDKTISTNVVNGYRSTSIAIGGAQAANITSGTPKFTYRLTEGSSLNASDFSGIALTITGAGTTAGAASTLAFATVSGSDGVSRTFSVKNATTGLNGSTADLSTTGAKTITLTDGLGNEVDVSFTVATAFANGDVATLTATTTNLNTSQVDINLNDLTVANPTITGTGTVTASTSSISAVTFNGLNPPKISDLGGVTISLSAATAAASTFSATVGGKSFTSTLTTDLTSAGAKSVILRDADGNEFTLAFTVGATVFVNGDTATFAVSRDHLPVVNNRDTKLLNVFKGTSSTFDFGTLDTGTVTFSSVGGSSTATLTLGDGTAFTSTTNVDLTTAGLKTVTLLNGTGASQTRISFQFNVTTAFDADDSFNIQIGELGQLVGANATSTGSTTFEFKVGTGTTVNDSVSFSLGSATTSSLSIDTTSIATRSGADTAIGLINSAITTISSRRADVGAAQSRLEFASADISVSIANTTAAQSAILDVDVAAEITKFTSQNVLVQAGVSLLSQANQQPALLLRLLQ